MRNLLAAFTLATAALAPAAEAGQTKPDVVLVVWDATRADHLTPYGYARDTTPNLDALGKSGLVFEHASSTAPWTLPSVAGLFTGMFNHNHGVDFLATDFSLDLPANATTIAEMAKAAGYTTGLWSAQTIYFQQDGFLQGFDKAVSLREMQPSKFHEAALQFIDQAGDTPAFIVIYYLDPHAPYEPPPEHDLWRDKNAPPVNIRGCPKEPPPGGFPTGHVGHCDINGGTVTLTDAQWQQLRDRYDGELHANDALFGQLVAGLKTRGSFDNTAIFFTSDHGEAFNDHPDEKTWHRLPYDMNLHVPLIAKIPGVAPRRVKTVVRTIDILPSIADVIGATPPKVNGISLKELAKKDGADRPVIGHSHFAGAPAFFRDGPYKLIFSRQGKEWVRLYDLSADPDEKHDLSAERPDLVQQMKDKRKAFLEASTLSIGAQDQATQEELERLRALGYVN